MQLGAIIPGTDPVQFGPHYARPFALDRSKAGPLVWDRWHSVRQDYGNVTVSVETDDREHHSTVRAQAARFVREHLGPDWHILAYLGREHYRNVAGHSAYARRFSVVHIPS